MRSLYRLLLRLLPRDFDARDRREMLEHHDARVARARHDSRVAGVVTRLSEVIDLLRTLLRVRARRGILDSLRQDLRVGLRSLRRSPAVTAMAVVSLGLGIGATAAVSSAVDVWLIRSLPVDDADRLVAITMSNRAEGWLSNPFSSADLRDWRDASRSVEIAGYRPASGTLRVDGRVEEVGIVQATRNLADVLGFGIRVGRGFSVEEERGEGAGSTVVSHAFWRDALGSDPDPVGRTIEIAGEPRTIVGVLEPGVGFGPFEGDVWLPLRLAPDASRDNHSLQAVGRLAEGVGLAAAREELDAVAARVAELDPERTFPDARVVPLRDAVYDETLRQGSLLLGAAVLLVLLIACANISNLLLARGVSRRHELAVRASLGAGRGRILRQLLTESVLLAVVGGVVGLGVGFLGVEALRHFVLPTDVPGWSRLALDGRVLAATAAVTVLSALLFGLVPALRGSRVDLRARLGEASGTGGSRGRRRLSTALVVGEIAMALVLLTSAGLVLSSLTRMHGLDLGFRTDGVVVFRVYAPTDSHPGAEGTRRFHERISDEVAALPGVRAVASTSGPPVGGWSTFLYSEAGASADGDRSRRSAENRVVSPGYAGLMEMQLVAGRWFSADDDPAGAPPTAVVSRVLAEHHWSDPAEAPGRTLDLGEEEVTVVGVVEAGRLRGPHREAPPVVFRSLTQHTERALFHVVETGREPAAVLGEIREVVHSVDPTATVRYATTVPGLVDSQLEADRAALRLFGALAALALTLTLVGVYGVMAHSVAERRREMGLRLALGAERGRLMRMVLARSGRTALFGLAAGGLASLAAGPALASVLPGVEPTDPAVLVTVSVALLLAVLLAAFVPARRAVRTDPVEPLREA